MVSSMNCTGTGSVSAADQAAEKDSYASLRSTDCGQRTRRVRLHSSIFARLASEILSSSLNQSLSIKTAKALGLTIPPVVLMRAKKVVR